jgi:hypothetical protein
MLMGSVTDTFFDPVMIHPSQFKCVSNCTGTNFVNNFYVWSCFKVNVTVFVLVNAHCDFL